MDIKVVGTGCDKCDKLYENTCAAVRELGLNASVSKVEDLMEIVKLGVMTSPSLMANGRLLVSGQVASAEKIKSLLGKLAQTSE